MKAKSNEIEAKMNESKYTEESLKASKLEDKLIEFKEKAASKLAKACHKYFRTNVKFIKIKVT